MKKPRRGDPSAKLQANLFGSRAEWIATAWLLARGYRVLARNFVVKGGEIDIVAQRGATIAFVEVKARKEFEQAVNSIQGKKRRRISCAARVWLARNPWAITKTLRGDAVYITPWRLPHHSVAAYTIHIY
jgi:putative endonuclease